MTADLQTLADLREFLKEMFQFNFNDLDFGIFKIYNLKRQQITQFIDGEGENDLAPTIERILAEVSLLEQQTDTLELRRFLQNLNQQDLLNEPQANYGQLELFVGTERDPAKKERLQAALQATVQSPGGIQQKLRDQIYNHLLGFFGMYYEHGDFGYKSRSRTLYQVPYEADYDGADTLFHWKHKGSLYIKTANAFNAIKFKFRDKTLEFRLETNEQSQNEDTAQNNNKDQNVKHYQLHRIEQDAEGTWRILFNFAEKSTPKHEIYARIYQEVFGETDLSKYLVFQKEKTKNGKKTVETEGVFNDLTDDYDKVQSGALKGLSALRIKKETAAKNAETNFPRGAKLFDKDKNQFTDPTLADLYELDHKLNAFYIGHDADYFIHQDLHGFLTREKERYVKNYLFADLESIFNGRLDNSTIIVAKAFDRIATRIIGFLSAIEEFQKDVFTRKKKVVESEYCATLDLVPADLHPQILENTDQIAEWQALFGLTVKTAQDLSEHPTLTVDTRHFRQPDGSNPFKDALLNSLDDLDAHTGGLLINSENYQALNLLQEKYRERVKCVYIDPPYNTGGDGFFYKDVFRHSSWLSMIFDRLKLTHPLLNDAGVLYSSIDANERAHLEQALNIIFGLENRVEEVIWAQNSNKNQSPTFSTNHEYVSVYSKNLTTVKQDFRMFREVKPGLIEIKELLDELNPTYPSIKSIEAALRDLYKKHREEIEDEENDEWKGIYNYNRAEYRDANGNMVAETEAKNVEAKIWVWTEGDASMPQVKADSQKSEFRDPDSPEFRFYRPVHPVTGKPCSLPKRGWVWPYDAHGNQKNWFKKLADDNRIAWGETEEKVPRVKKFLNEVETNVAKSLVMDFTDGERQLSNVFGKTRSFSNPKPTTLISRFVGQSNVQNSFCIDYFAGSGTTGHAVLNLNKQDGGGRKYILVEMGAYFDTVTKPRIRKVIYSQNWKEGKPQDRDGTCRHLLKYLVLEQYEDVLDHIEAAAPTSPERLPLQYIYRPDLNRLDDTLDLSRPFHNRIRYGKPSRTGFVDVPDTYHFLMGYHLRSFKTLAENGRTYRVAHTTGEVLVVWRDIRANEDDAAAVLAILARYPDARRVELNHYFELAKYADEAGNIAVGEGRQVQVRVISRDDFNR